MCIYLYYNYEKYPLSHLKPRFLVLNEQYLPNISDHVYSVHQSFMWFLWLNWRKSEGPISCASESLIVIFLPWYNCCVYVLNGNKMFFELKKKWIEIHILSRHCSEWFNMLTYCDVIDTRAGRQQLWRHNDRLLPCGFYGRFLSTME